MPSSRYILFKKIARGGMAEIYLGKQIGEDGFERVCCIKRILPHYAQEDEFIEMFRDEAHICKRLQHANIVRVEGFEEVEGSYAIIMEFIDGADVRAILSACEKKSEALSVPMAVYIIAEAARGLHYAHSKIDEVSNSPLEIVHRDISPQNLLVSFEGEVKVTDFGIADAGNKETETKPGIVKGKYSYMSPEQISAMPVDARTDVFALSIVLWEILAMKRLFQGDNEVLTIQAVKSGKITRNLADLNPNVDEELLKIIYKGLKKDARDRYASAAALEKDLRKYLNKNFPDFSAEDLGSHLKILLRDRREESLVNIKELLSEKVLATTAVSTASSGSINAFSASDVSSIPSAVTPPQVSSSGSASLQPLRVGGQGGALGGAPSFDVTGANSPPTLGGTNLNRRPRTSAYQSRASGTNVGTSSVRRHKQKKSSNGLSYVLIAIAVLALAGGGYFLVKKAEKSKLPATLEIRTTPAVVRVVLDGQPIEEHAYLKTPLVIRQVSKGEHTMVFSRHGFADETVVILAEAGAQIRRDDIVLKQISKMAPVRLTFKSTQTKEVKVVLDRGIVNETVRSGTVMNLEYITFGEQHTVTIYPEKSSPFRCQFIPRSRSWRAPYLIEVSLYDNRCKFPPR